MLTLMLAVVGPIACARLVQAGGRAAAADRVRDLGTRSRWRIPARWRGPLIRALHDADLPWTPEQAVERWAIGVTAVGLLAAAFAPGLAVPAALAAAVAGPVALRAALAVALGHGSVTTLVDCGTARDPASRALVEVADVSLVVLRGCYLALRRAVHEPALAATAGAVLLEESGRKCRNPPG